MGRSRQSPHAQQKPREMQASEDMSAKNVPVIQIDYCYTFTKERHELPEVEDEGPDQPEEAPDQRDQFGLNLVACESTTGWAMALPILEKGAGSLKRTTEQLARLSMQVTATEPSMFQGHPEASMKQVINSVEACRLQKRILQRGSHPSNGLAEKAVDTLRRNSLTLRAYFEDRIKAKVGGHCHVFAWLMRQACFIPA